VALVVFDQPAASRHPGEGAFYDQTLGQQDESLLGLCKLDHAQFDAVLAGSIGDFLPV
jgi:hypothetical protein